MYSHVPFFFLDKSVVKFGTKKLDFVLFAKIDWMNFVIFIVCISLFYLYSIVFI